MIFNLEQDPDGIYPPVSIRQQVSSRSQLRDLQQNISGIIPEFRPQDLSDPHVNFLKLGYLDVLYAEIVRTRGSDLAYGQFAAAIQEVLDYGSNRGVTTASQLLLTGFEQVGYSNSPVLVAIVEQRPDWLEKRRALLRVLERSLRICGIVYINNFFTTSSGLSFQAESIYRPHIKLGTLTRWINQSILDKLKDDLPYIWLERTKVYGVSLVEV